jgi:uncharacterized protein DUF4333
LSACANCRRATACGSSTSSQPSTAATTTAVSKGTVDQTQVEKGIEESLSTTAVKITSAKCPRNVQAAVGATFTCDVILSNGSTGKATVTQTGVNHFTHALEPGSVRIPGSTADAAIEKSLAGQGSHMRPSNVRRTSSSRSGPPSHAASAAPRAWLTAR